MLNRSIISTIKVVGVGGAGINSVNHMITHGLSGVEFIAIDFDASSLERSKAPVKLLLSSPCPRKTFPEFADFARTWYQQSATRRVKILNTLGEVECAIIVAGLGGSAGSVAAPVVAAVVKEAGALTIGLTTTPFSTEGGLRQAVANYGMNRLHSCVDTLLVIDNARLPETIENQFSNLGEAFLLSDDKIWRAVQCIVGLCTAQCLPAPRSYNESIGNLLKPKKGECLAGRLGVGWASGGNRVREAVLMATTSSLLGPGNGLKTASRLLLEIVCAPEINLTEIREVANSINAASKANAEILFDVAIDKNFRDELYITLVCLGEPDEDMPQTIKVDLSGIVTIGGMQ
jgi:cell division protein FtsZ